MSDNNICDSWEDVDVDNIVIKSNEKKSYAFVANNSLVNNNSNNCFNIVENGENIIVNSDDNCNYGDGGIGGGNGTFRILPRANNISASNQITTSVPASSILPGLGSERPNIIIDDNNSSRSQFVNKLRILNRPNKADDRSQDKDRTSVEVNQLLMRSFEEKKAEYSKARLRILGEEGPAQKLVLDEVGDSMDQLTMNDRRQSSSSLGYVDRSPTKSTKSVSSTNSSLSSSSSSILNANNRKQTTQLSSSSSPSSSPLLPSPVNTNTNTTTNENLTLIRQPTVPDGTKGFGNRSNWNNNNNNNNNSSFK